MTFGLEYYLYCLIEVSTRYRDFVTNTAGSRGGPRDEVVHDMTILYDCMTTYGAR
jgi:hypothetical protein